jgi:hypothetical protein
MDLAFTQCFKKWNIKKFILLSSIKMGIDPVHVM